MHDVCDDQAAVAFSADLADNWDYRQFAEIPCYGSEVSRLLPQQFPVIDAAGLALYCAGNALFVGFP
jgi:hypothetical protein